MPTLFYNKIMTRQLSILTKLGHDNEGSKYVHRKYKLDFCLFFVVYDKTFIVLNHHIN